MNNVCPLSAFMQCNLQENLNKSVQCSTQFLSLVISVSFKFSLRLKNVFIYFKLRTNPCLKVFLYIFLSYIYTMVASRWYEIEILQMYQHIIWLFKIGMGMICLLFYSKYLFTINPKCKQDVFSSNSTFPIWISENAKVFETNITLC